MFAVSSETWTALIVALIPLLAALTALARAELTGRSNRRDTAANRAETAKVKEALFKETARTDSLHEELFEKQMVTSRPAPPKK